MQCDDQPNQPAKDPDQDFDFHDGGIKYNDTDTGAHFEYNDLFERLNQVKTSQDKEKHIHTIEAILLQKRAKSCKKNAYRPNSSFYGMHIVPQKTPLKIKSIAHALELGLLKPVLKSKVKS